MKYLIKFIITIIIMFGAYILVKSSELSKIEVVELDYFDAKQIDTLVKIEWGTASEYNSKGFSLQRKLDEINNEYEDVAYLQGAGNTLKTTNYSYIDSTAETGKSYLYRLKIEDFDGTKTNSNEVYISIEKLTTSVNIKSENIEVKRTDDRIDISFNERLDLPLELINLYGNNFSKSINLINDHNIIIDITTFNNGVYFLTNKSKCFFKFIK